MVTNNEAHVLRRVRLAFSQATEGKTNEEVSALLDAVIEDFRKHKEVIDRHATAKV